MSGETDGSIWGRLQEVARSVPGWSPPEELHSLYCLAQATSPLRGDLLEIGSWCGRSSVALGLAARATGCRLWCVDLFPAAGDWFQNADGSYSMAVTIGSQVHTGYTDQTVWREPFERDIAPLYRRFPGTYEAFQATIEQHGLSNVVSSYRGTVEGFLGQPTSSPPRVRLAFIDGDHGYDSVCRDIRSMERVLVEGGYLCFDDAFTSYQGVNRAIEELVINSPGYELGVQLTRKLFAARKRSAIPAGA